MRRALPASGRAAALALALLVGGMVAGAPRAAGAAAALPARLATAPLVDVAEVVPSARLDMAYARSDNFTGEVLYPVARCLLRPAVADMLAQVAAQLAQERPELRLLLKDCYRPISVQRRMYAALAGTRRQGYVANPDVGGGSVHSFGAAIDLTLCTQAGVELDMGTPFDFLGARAEPRREAALRAAGALTPAQLAHRQLLRRLMQAAGFRPISNEWWHFDAWRFAELRRRYAPLDLPLAPTPAPLRRPQSGAPTAPDTSASPIQASQP